MFFEDFDPDSIDDSIVYNDLDFPEPSMEVTDDSLLSSTDSENWMNSPLNSDNFDNGLNLNESSKMGAVSFGCCSEPDYGSIDSVGSIHYESSSFNSNDTIDSADQNHSVEESDSDHKGLTFCGSGYNKWACHACGHVFYCDGVVYAKCPKCYSSDTERLYR